MRRARPGARAVRWSTVMAVGVLVAGCSAVAGDARKAAPGSATGGSAAADEQGRINPDGFMPDWIPGLRIIRDGSDDATCPWSTAYPEVPGAVPLTKALRAGVIAWPQTVRKGGVGADRQDCVERAGSPGLQVTFSFVIASGDVVGVRQTADDTSSGGSVYTQTRWYDGRTGTVEPALALFADTTIDQAIDRIIAKVATQPGYSADMARASLTEEYRQDTLDDLSFDDTGALHARFEPGEVAIASSGPKEAVLSRTELTGLLSDLGTRAQTQALHPEHRLTLPNAGQPGAATSTPASASASSPDTPPDQGGATTAPPAPSVDCHAVKCIALTFDDGPGPYTRELLATLATYHARSTFFLIGQSVVADPGTVRAEIAAGHEVGNHTWTHPELPRLTAAQVSRQLSLTDDAIRRAIGRTPTLVRPPYGAVNPSVSQAIARPVILWNRDTLDWKVRNTQKVADTVITQAQPGDIILMHDIHPTTVQAVPTILQTLSARGYHFVTVSQLFAGTTLTPTHNYFSNAAIAKPAQALP